MITQLHTPLPLLTPKGKAWAVAIIDYGPQWDLQWVTFVAETGECWTFRNQDIRREENYTFALPKPTPIASREKQTMRPHANDTHINGKDINGKSLNGANAHSNTPPSNI